MLIRTTFGSLEFERDAFALPGRSNCPPAFCSTTSACRALGPCSTIVCGRMASDVARLAAGAAPQRPAKHASGHEPAPHASVRTEEDSRPIEPRCSTTWELFACSADTGGSAKCSRGEPLGGTCIVAGSKQLGDRASCPNRPRRRDARRARQLVVSRFKPRLWKIVATTSFGATGRSAGYAADRVAATDDAAPLDAAAGKITRPALRPVVAAAGRIDPRRAAELGQVADQRVVEHAALVEVFDQARYTPGRTSAPRCSRMPSIDVNGLVPWMSQVISSKTVRNVLTVTNRTPASISRRASRQHWPKRLRAVALADRLPALASGRRPRGLACWSSCGRPPRNCCRAAARSGSSRNRSTVCSTMLAELAAAGQADFADFFGRQQVGNLESSAATGSALSTNGSCAFPRKPAS